MDSHPIPLLEKPGSPTMKTSIAKPGKVGVCLPLRPPTGLCVNLECKTVAGFLRISAAQS
jgi:hypothetical protein